MLCELSACLWQCQTSSARVLQELRSIPGVGALLDALAAYTERHLARMDRLRRSVSLLDYTLGCMHVIEETGVEVRALPHCILCPERMPPIHHTKSFSSDQLCLRAEWLPELAPDKVCLTLRVSQVICNSRSPHSEQGR